MNTRRRR